MKIPEKYHIKGYVSRCNIKCDDGVTIQRGAFKHQSGVKVPMVWQHDYDDPKNVLGHVIIHDMNGEPYGYGVFNDSEMGQHVYGLTKNGDIDSFSIMANRLKKNGQFVTHGTIREVSLVMAGANDGAKIDQVSLVHALDGDDLAYVMHTTPTGSVEGADDDDGDEDDGDGQIEHAAGDDVDAILDSMTDEQLNLMYAMMQKFGKDEKVQHSSDDGSEGDDEGGTNNMKDKIQHGNMFKQNQDDPKDQTLSHKLSGEQLKAMLVSSRDEKSSFREKVLAHAAANNIDDISLLFGDPKLVERDVITRDMGWVSRLLGGIKKSPMSKIKTHHWDITGEKARAKGYVKGTEKTDQVVTLARRDTSPTTIYVKTTFDQDDILDAEEEDFIPFIKGEMDELLDEEQARAILLGDGRAIDDPNKIKEDKIIPIYKDTEKEFYAFYVHVTAEDEGDPEIEKIVKARKNYKGSGNPVMFTTEDQLNNWLFIRDLNKRRIYNSVQELATALRVSAIITVDPMEGVSRDDETNIYDLKAIIVNPRDYTSGANKGGGRRWRDFFDIDFNQQKYLAETRRSGMLTRYHSAMIVEKVTAKPVSPDLG